MNRQDNLAKLAKKDADKNKLDASELTEAVDRLKDVLGVGVEITNLNSLVEELSKIEALDKTIKNLERALVALKLPKNIAIKGLDELVSEVRRIESQPDIITQNIDLQPIKGISKSIDILVKKIKEIKVPDNKLSQKPQDYIPTRRVLLVGKTLVFDDSFYNSSGGGVVQDALIENNRVKTVIQAGDSPSIDAFGRWRISDPQTIFDSKQLFDNQPLFWDEELESGADISSSYSANTASTVITSTLNTAGVFTRQTFMRFNYQPGKSQLILITGILDRSGGGTGVERRIGLFDDNNGLFFEDNAGTIGVTRRTYVTGTPADNTVAQASWNIDPMDGTGPSGVTIDWTKTQIFVIDFEWLGVGRVRMGLNIDGITYYVHQFLNSNILDKVYISTPNLPLRYQMITTGSSPVSTMEAICSTVISEGGLEDTGIDRHASTANTQVDCAVVGTIYAIKGIRLKSTHLSTTVKILKASTQVQSASDDLEWLLIFNPTVAGTPTWTAETNSSVETATGATANTVTNGTYIAGGYVGTGAGQSSSAQVDSEINNALRLGADISNNVDTIWLCGRSLNNVNVLVEGALSWKELS